METTFILPELRSNGKWYTQTGPISFESDTKLAALLWFIEQCDCILELLKCPDPLAA